MKYLSTDYQDEIVQRKNVGFAMLGVFIAGVIAVIYNPEGRGWMVVATAIFGYVAHFLSGGKEHVKKGECIVLKEREFEYRIVKTGYQVCIPYEDLEGVKRLIFPPNSIKLVLTGNRVLTMNNFDNSSNLSFELRSRASI